MSFGKTFGLGVLLWALLGALKYAFLRVFNFDTTSLHLAYWFLVFVLTITVVRRVGVLNYIEAMVLMVLWTVLILVLDSLFLLPSLGREVFGSQAMWYGYLVLAITIFVLHKKRHVEIRKQHHAHAAHGDGHGHGGGHKSHGDHSQQPHGQHQPGKHH